MEPEAISLSIASCLLGIASRAKHALTLVIGLAFLLIDAGLINKKFVKTIRLIKTMSAMTKPENSE